MLALVKYTQFDCTLHFPWGAKIQYYHDKDIGLFKHGISIYSRISKGPLALPLASFPDLTDLGQHYVEYNCEYFKHNFVAVPCSKDYIHSKV